VILQRPVGLAVGEEAVGNNLGHLAPDGVGGGTEVGPTAGDGTRLNRATAG
jgi:hypothetical protein